MKTFRKRGFYTPVAALYAGGGGGSTYTAQGVTFNGTTTYINRGAALTGAATSNKGMVSFWFKMKGGDGNFHMFFEDDAGGANGLQILRLTDNTMRFNGNPASAFSVKTVTTFTTGMGWAHIICSWDTTHSIDILQVYTNDVADISGTPGLVDNMALNWTTPTDWGLGARLSGGAAFFIDADIADFYINTAEMLDLTVTANRRKFISAGLAPVDLGSDGSTPTGNAPTMFFHGTVASWPTNDGVGGGFTLNGTLAAASTNPP